MHHPQIVVAAILIAGVAASQSLDPWRPAVNPDPLRVATPALEPALAAPLADGEWRVAVGLAYFNLFRVADEIAAFRRDNHLTREPVTGAQLRAVEALHPSRPLWLLDLEGVRTDLVVGRGLPNGWTVSLAVPWLAVGAPHWDAIAERWHDWTGLPGGSRDRFPRGASLVYLRGRDGFVERRDLDRSGLGDATLALATPPLHAGGGDHRFVLAVQAPTGEADTLAGSGGWDAGLQWFAAWPREPTTWLAGAGLTHAGNGTLLGVERGTLWHLLGALDLRLGRRLHATARLTYERSPLATLDAGDPADPALLMRFGVALPLPSGRWLTLELGQDWPGLGVAPDYSLHLALGGTLGRR